jgi:hypothetical protein
MTKRGQGLDQVRVTTPCDADWNAMRGDDASRFCEACGKHVHNLSAMTLADAERLVANEPRACVRFQRRADGTTLTRAARTGMVATAAAMMAAGISSACDRNASSGRAEPSSAPPSASSVASDPHAGHPHTLDPTIPVYMGAVAPPPKLRGDADGSAAKAPCNCTPGDPLCGCL